MKYVFAKDFRAYQNFISEKNLDRANYKYISCPLDIHGLQLKTKDVILLDNFSLHQFHAEIYYTLLQVVSQDTETGPFPDGSEE